MATIRLILVKKYIEKRVLAGILPIQPHLGWGVARDGVTVSGSAEYSVNPDFIVPPRLRGSIDCFLALLTDFQLVLAPLPSPVETCLDICARISRRWVIRCKDGRTGFRPKWIRIEQHVPNTDLRVTEHQRGVGWGKWVEQRSG